MDEKKLKPFYPFNIIMFAQFGKEAGWNISTCESHHSWFSGIFLLEGSFQLLEVTS
jgi:hypothetical protein